MKQKLLALAMSLILALGLCACGSAKADFPNEGNALVIILGNHANANRCDSKTITKELMPLVEKCSTRWVDGEDYHVELKVSVLVSDSNPAIETIEDNYKGQVYTAELTFDSKTPEKSMKELRELYDIVEAALQNSEGFRADDPGADLPTAIAEAQLILKANPGKENHIFIYDTGIVTHGPMAMGSGEGQLNVQSGTAKEVLNKVKDSAFTDLSGIKVHFYGLGDVCIGQKDMRDFRAEDPDFTSRMEQFWMGYLERCGAELMNTITYTPSSEDTSRAMLWDVETDPYPEVPNVPFVNIVPPEPVDEEQETVIAPISLTSSELGGFKGDSAVFKNKDRAIAALRSYETTLLSIKNDPSLQLYVVGSRAMTSPKDDFVDHETSRGRALAVSDLIQELFGIPASQIVEIDAGVQRFSWSSDAEEFPGGKDPGPEAKEAAQAQHRVVTLIPSTNADQIQELGTETDIRP